MANIGTAYFQLIPSMKGVEAEVKKALSGIDTTTLGKTSGGKWSGGFTSAVSKGGAVISGVFAGIASTAVSGLISAVGSLGSEMAAAADSSQKFASTLEFAGIDTATIDQLTASTQEYADATVYELADIRNATAQLAANGVDNYAQLAEAAGNLNAVAGGNAETFKSVSMVMSQTAGSGKLMTENWNQLTDAIPGASGALQEAMRSAGAFEGNFREAMEDGEISADEFFAAVQKLGMTDVAIEAATSTSTIEGAMGNLEASVVGLGSTVLTALTPALTGAMANLSGLISSVTAGFSGFMAALQGGTDMATAFNENIAPMVSSLGQSLMTGVQSFVAQIPTYAPMVIQGAASLFQGLATGLGQVLPLLAQGLGSLIQSAIVTLPQWLPQVISGAFNLFIGIVTAVGTILISLVDGIAQLIMGGISSFANWAGYVISGAQELWNNAVTGVLNTLGDFASAVGEVIQGGIDAVADFIGSAVDAGANLIQGFIDGVLGAAQGLIDAVGGAINDAIGWAKSLLGIASPSKVFAEIGDYTMLGFASGIEDGAKSATSSMRSAMRSVYGAANGFAVSAGLNFSSSPFPSSDRGYGNTYVLNLEGISAHGRETIESLMLDMFSVMRREGAM